MADVIKSRVWACIVYPENISYDSILSILKTIRIPCAISPLHDPSQNASPSKGEKLHYHVLFRYANTTTKAHVDSIISELKGTKAQRVYDEYAYYRYLTHLDDSDKQQFDGISPTHLCGYAPPLDDSTNGAYLAELFAYLPTFFTLKCTNFYALCKHYQDIDRPDMVLWISKHASFVRALL